MTYFEIGFLVALATISFGIFYGYRRSLRLAQERHDKIMREIEESNERIRQARAERRSKMAQWATTPQSRRVEETAQHRRRYSDDRTMIHNDDSGADILTQMILQQALSSPTDTVTGTVSWSNDTPTITPSSSYESSSSSSYSSYSSSDSSSSYSSSDSGSSSSCD